MAAVDVSYTVQGRGPALYMVHGIGSRRVTWDALVAGLKDDFTCVTFDLRGHGASPVPPLFDTRAAGPPLTPTVPRTYEMRAATVPFATALGAPDRMIRWFGDVAVRSDVAEPGVTRAGGQVYSWVDTLSCVHVVPIGVFGSYVVENPPAGGSWSGFVRGYVYTPAAPKCGETRVFHLESLEQ